VGGRDNVRGEGGEFPEKDNACWRERLWGEKRTKGGQRWVSTPKGGGGKKAESPIRILGGSTFLEIIRKTIRPVGGLYSGKLGAGPP